jgi:hypothetical protein
MILDGTDVSTFGVIVEDRNPSRSAAATKLVVDGAPGAWRRIHLGDEAPDALEIEVRGHVVAASLAALASRIDELKFRLRPRREIAVRWSDTSDREWFGYRHKLAILDLPPGWVMKGSLAVVRFQASIICPDPFAHELSQQTLESNGAAPQTVTPTVGTAPMPVVITLTGNNSANLVNPVLHYRDGSDTDIITLSYGGTLNGSDVLIINTETFVATLNGSNAGGDISGSYFDVDPGDGDPYAGSPTYPDIQLTADSGTADLFRVQYYRRYW